MTRRRDAARTPVDHVRPVLLAAGLVLLALAVVVAVLTPASGWWVALGAVGPDLAFLAAAGDRPAAPRLMPPRMVPLYNALHRAPPPVLLTAAASAWLLLGGPTAGWHVLGLGLAWCAHVVVDRGAGYTLRDRDGAMPHQRHLVPPSPATG